MSKAVLWTGPCATVDDLPCSVWHFIVHSIFGESVLALNNLLIHNILICNSTSCC